MPAPINVDESVVTPCGELFKTTAKHRNSANPAAPVWSINIPDEYKEDRKQISGSTIREGMYSVILGGCTHWGYTNHFCNRQCLPL